MFKIDVRTNAVADFQMKKEIAKPSAQKLLEDGMKTEQWKLNSRFQRKYIDVQQTAKNFKDYKRNFERTCPETLSPSVQNILWKKAKALKDEITMGMLSAEELHPVKQFLVDGTIKTVVNESHINELRSIERQLMWEKKNKEKVREFKNIMRHLMPDNPAAGDIEHFRPKMRGIR